LSSDARLDRWLVGGGQRAGQLAQALLHLLQREEVHQAGRCLQGRLLPSGLWSTVPRVQGTRARPPLPPGQGALHQRQLWVQLDLVEERVGGSPALLPGFHLGLHPGVEQVAFVLQRQIEGCTLQAEESSGSAWPAGL